jgi:hypothetical protein
MWGATSMTDLMERTPGKSVVALSKEWFTLVEIEAQSLLDESAHGMHGVFCMVEYYRNAPSVGEIYGDRLPGYKMKIERGKVNLVAGAVPSDTEGADLVISLDYEAFKVLSQLASGPDLDVLTDKFKAEGAFSIVGNASAMPFNLSNLHDRMTAQTIALA